MDAIIIKRREIFFNNLILLGLEKTSLEREYGITFHRDMFALPNKKGYEVVTHFLFEQLSSATGENYNIPWPLVCKEHDRTFQKTVASHLMNFSEENCVRFPRIVPSLLLNFGGDRFYEVYLAFSSYVLYKRIKQNGNIRPLLSRALVTRDNYTSAKEVCQFSTILNVWKFRDTEVVAHQSHKIWSTSATNLEERLRELKRSIKSNEELLKEKKSIVSSLYSTEPDKKFNLSKIMENCFESLKPVLKQRKILDKFIHSERKYWQQLCSEVGENSESEVLNGQDYGIQVSDYLPEEYVKELKSAGCISSHENGKLSVDRFIKIFMAYLTFIVDLLIKVNLNDVHQACSVENASAIEDDLNCINDLNVKLSDDVLPNIKKKIDKLNALTGYDDIEENSELSSDLFCPLPTPSFDTEAVEQRTAHFGASLETISCPLSKKELCSEKDDDSVVSSETNLLEHRKVLTPRSSKLTERSINDHSSTLEVPVAGPILSSNTLISPLNDLDSSCSAHFKMNDSWLQEESLFTVTLPDTPIDE